MLHGIDHVVILVPNLDEAVDSYTRLGFTVVPGGRHTVGTYNALIGFQDGSYIELIAFWEDAPQHRWHRFLALGGGLVDYCMRTDDLRGDVAVLRAAGVAMSEDQPMSRSRPDGYRVDWTLSLATEAQGMTPFLIEDATPREERVPRLTEHANGVSGICALTIAVRDLAVAAPLASLLGESRPLEKHDVGGQGIRYVSNGHRLDFVRPGSHGAIADELAGRGRGGVFGLSLRTSGPEVAIEPGQSQNARLSLVHAGEQ